MTKRIEIQTLDCTKLIEREGWDCATCGHRHAGRTLAYICVGCPCDEPPPAGEPERTHDQTKRKQFERGAAPVHATEETMSKQGYYGYPNVSDPNDFIPDGESCSPEELAAHRLACQTYPNHQPNKGCTTERSDDGQLVVQILRTSWGIGTNLIQCCDGCREPAFGDPLTVCHECGPEFCAVCWPEHDKSHEVEP